MRGCLPEELHVIRKFVYWGKGFIRSNNGDNGHASAYFDLMS